MKKLLLAISLVALGACTPDSPYASKPLTENTDACGAKALQNLIGKPASALETIKFAAETRVIRPNDAVTMDYNLSRLNIAISDKEEIVGVACG